MSDSVERRLVALLGHPRTSPFGNPIPGLDELDDWNQPAPADQRRRPLADAAAAGQSSVLILRIGEQVQHDRALMVGLQAAGVRPGALARVQPVADGYELAADGTPIVLPGWAADLIMVSD